MDAATWGGPGQASAGAARCTRGCAIGEIGPVQRGGLDQVVERRRARMPPALSSSALRGITSVPARMSSATSDVRWESRQGTTSRRRKGARQTGVQVAPRPGWAWPTGRPGPPRSTPRDGRVPGRALRPRRGGGASRLDRTHRGARDWQRYGGMGRCMSPGAAMGPDAGAGGVTAEAARARAGEPAARPVARAWRAAGTLWVRIRWPRSPTGTLPGVGDGFKRDGYRGVYPTTRLTLAG